MFLITSLRPPCQKATVEAGSIGAAKDSGWGIGRGIEFLYVALTVLELILLTRLASN